VITLKRDRRSAENMRDIRASKQLQRMPQPEVGWFVAVVLALGDIAGLAMAWHFAEKLNQSFAPIPKQLVWWEWFGLSSLFWVFAFSTVVLFAYHNFYSATSQWRNYVKQAQVISTIYLLSLVVAYFYDPKLDAPRSLFFTAWMGSIVFVIGIRLGVTIFLHQFRFTRSQIPVFIIAPRDRIALLTEMVEHRVGYRVVGAVESSQAHLSSTMQLVKASGAREVLADSLPETKLASNLYWQLRNAQISLLLVPSSLVMLHRRGAPEIFAGMPTIRIEPQFFAIWEYRLKRLFDVCGALLGIVCLAPVFVFVAIAIKFSSPGGVFYSQERVGLHGQVFRMWKFRTMCSDADKQQAELEQLNESKDGVMFKIKHDPRIIPIGRFLRRTSIDELPQLFNVLMGQMSMVGPRPLPIRDVARFDEWHHTRHLVLPGITGFWQVSGRSQIDTIDDAARLDLFYIDHWSFNLDLEILIETIRIVLFSKGAY
jgi:exopolysaccharide biosynthesis polyprenyl glycosylphosphotransferase